MIVLGIDPGLTGAISVLDSQGPRLLECADLPVQSNGTAGGSMRNWLDVATLRKLLGEWSQRHAFGDHDIAVAIERPIAMPTLPAQTIASQFDTFGALRGLFASPLWGRNVLFPSPTWKRGFGLKGGKDAKTESRECALRLYPSAPVTRVKDHNRAESILIAHWCLGEVA
jgi:hypothetical protein